MGVLSSHSPNASSDEGEQISFFANCIREQMYSEYYYLQILNILNNIHSLRDLTFLKTTPPRICLEGCSNWRKSCQSTKKEDPIKLLFCSRAFLETLSEILGHQHHVHEPLTSLSLGDKDTPIPYFQPLNPDTFVLGPTADEGKGRVEFSPTRCFGSSEKGAFYLDPQIPRFGDLEKQFKGKTIHFFFSMRDRLINNIYCNS